MTIAEPKISSRAVALLVSFSLAVLIAGCQGGPSHVENDATELDTGGDVYVDVGSDVFEDDSDIADISNFSDVVVPLDYSFQPAAVKAVFQPDLADSDFFAIPFPSDLRLDHDGVPDVSLFPNPEGLAMVNDIKEMATYRRVGWHQTPACQFAFDGAIDPSSIPTDPWDLASADSPIQLIDITPGSRHYGERFPLVWHNWEVPDSIQPGNLLSFMPLPGKVLESDTTYVCVVNAGLKDLSGGAVGQAEPFWRVLTGHAEGTEEARGFAVYSPFIRFLADTADDSVHGIDPTALAGATVFTTGHTAAGLKTLYDNVQKRFDISTSSRTASADVSGAFVQTRAYDDFIVLEGSLSVPIFREGEEPYDAGGRFAFDSEGIPLVQRREDAPVVLTIPDRPMPPGGYPLVIYIHGSNGLSTQAVDRGRTAMVGGVAAEGEGPAMVLAREGFAVAAMALPMNPQRYAGGGKDAYQNLGNFPSVIGHYQQAVMELGLLLTWLENLTMEGSSIEGYTGQSSSLMFDFSKGAMAMGQSQGGQTLSLWSAVEPRLRAIVPSGVGGIYTLVFFLVTNPSVGELLNFMLGVNNADLDYMHPLMTLTQMGLENIDPVVTVRHINMSPFAGMQPKSVFYAAGYLDSEFPPGSIEAWVLGIGADLAGDRVDQTLFDDVQKSGGQVLEYPVSGNRPNPQDPENPQTVVVVQYPEDGILSGHHVNFQLDEPKFQYRCFFKSFFDTGVAVVYDPIDPSAVCPASM